MLSLNFETKEDVDDILIELESGRIFVQAKTSIPLSDKPGTELEKVAHQFVRQWVTCSTGDGDPDGHRPLHPDRDRLLLAVGPGAPTTISADLAQGLSMLQQVHVAKLSMRRARAVDFFQKQVARAWEAIRGQQATENDIRSITNLVTISSYDFDGADRRTAEAVLGNALDDPVLASATFSTIAEYCRESMAKNSGFDLDGLRRTLVAKGIPLNAPIDYCADVAKLREYSERTRRQLSDYDSIRVDKKPIRVERRCTDAVVDAASAGSLLVVGEPGSGKSAVINAAATKLKSSGGDVIELSVDRLSAESFADLGLEHPLNDVLRNWPGDGPAYLLIDALDATRRGDDDAKFRTLIEDVLSFETRTWSVIASIRTFDLRQGVQFKRLFPGSPPVQRFSDPSFANVAHILVPAWTPEEFAELLRNAPALSEAINTGGQRMRELACVPFNTRLIAELIAGGATDFGEVRSQVQLLRLYWENRVGKYGTAAERCLQATVAQMVESRRLRARKLDVQCPDAALDALLEENVLFVGHDQFVAFRHHILFDYAASRVFLRADDANGTANVLESDRGAGFLLAPAVGFLLHELWHSVDDMGRQAFWRAVTRICGDTACDPVARSVAARTASELPSARGDALDLLEELSAQAEAKDRAVRALRHVTGALLVRLEDDQHVPLDAWCQLVDCASESELISDLVGPLRILLDTFCTRIESDQQLHWLGRAARRLLSYALELDARYNQRLSSSAIGFVAMTYRSDSDESRRILSRLFEPDHFLQHADQEVPSLARYLDPISAVDPDFVVDVYEKAYHCTIVDETNTPLSNSQILRLSSSRRQDYEGSWWSLQQFFPRFLTTHHRKAVRALIRAVSGYIEREHKTQKETIWKISRRADETLLRNDGSYSWGRNLSTGHRDSACALIKHFEDHANIAHIDVARAMIDEVIASNEYAVLWSRAFLIASRRAKEVGDMLWGIATQEPFFTCHDTRDAALSFIAARYPYEDQASRSAFELRVMGYQFLGFERPFEAREITLRKLFLSLGKGYIATQEALQFTTERSAKPVDPDEAVSSPTIPSTDMPEAWRVLEYAGVDVHDPELRVILENTQEVEQIVSSDFDKLEPADITSTLNGVNKLVEKIFRASRDVPPPLANYGYEVAGRAALTLSRLSETCYSSHHGIHRSVVDLVIRLANITVDGPNAHLGEDSVGSNTSGSLSAHNVAYAVIKLMRLADHAKQQLLPIMKMLLRKGNNATRQTIVANLVVLAQFDGPQMWRLAHDVARTETDSEVLRALVWFLDNVLRTQSKRVEELVLMLHYRGSDGARSAGYSAVAGSGIEEIITKLWIRYGRGGSRRAIEDWISDPYTFRDELGHAIHCAREPLVLGYNGAHHEHEDIRERAQQFYGWIATALIERLKQYILLVARSATTENDKERGTYYAELLDLLCSGMFFATGASGLNSDGPCPLEGSESKRSFLEDMFSVLEGIGTVGAPPTIHSLIALLDFLAPGDPVKAFELISNALLRAGREYGYQFEVAGVDRVVEIVGCYLADHRGLFENESRRRKLQELLDVFVDAGWPAATRLLYRLPEML